MPNIANVQTTSNSNKCPHGLPVGTCPICNGMAMASKKQDNPVQKNKDEWSWMKCYIEGQMMKGARVREQNAKQILEKQIGISENIRNNTQKFIDNVQKIIDKIQNAIPKPLANMFVKIANSIMAPINNLILNIPNAVEKIIQFAQDIKSLLSSTIEKLTALFGEIKNFVEKKILDKFKKLTKKILRFFIWEDEEENLRDDEEIEKFKSRELKKLKETILRIKEKDDSKTH